MRDFFRLIVRVSAFLRKEIYEVLRQPRLIATLVLGPFMILLLFGIGYRNEPAVLRTIFVLQEGSAFEQQIEQYAETLGPQLAYQGSTYDQESALRSLRRGEVDLVAVVPRDAYETLQQQEQATFMLYHNEIDPFQADYVRYFGRVYIDEVNRRVLQNITDEGQDETLGARQAVAEARTNASEMRSALERGDVIEARQNQLELNNNLDEIEASVGTTADVLSNVQQTLGSGGSADAQAIRTSISAAREASTNIGTIDEESDHEAQAREAAELEATISDLDANLGDFTPINSRVLVRPFRSETESVAPTTQLAHYFAPAVIVLLLQHLAVTFAALSIVREKQLGTVELFRVAPISAGETLLGKYLSYLIFGSVLALILTLVLVAGLVLPIPGLQSLIGNGEVTLGLGVPMRGDWADYALVAFGLLFAALGYGFVISSIVDTDSQAVQYAMIILLTSVFFSGFFLRLETLWEPIRVVSWALPATYAIDMLQNIMLRGTTPGSQMLLSLFGMGVILYLAGLFLLQRSVSNKQ